MASIELKQLGKCFANRVRAVDDVSLQIRSGEFIVVVGPSGCGKTTLLRLIAGLESVTDGSLLFDGEDVSQLQPKDRDVSLVFQDFALYPHLSVRDNLAFPLRMRKVKTSEMASRIEETAATLGITELLDRMPSQLSGGQQQRVALGRAVVRRPSIFLFDEPLSNLDAQLRSQMRGEIRRLQRQVGSTTIYVTHDQLEAMTMGDRIVVLRNGKVQQFADADTLYTRPANAFVARFVGTPAMNQLIGQLRRNDGHLEFASQDRTIRLTTDKWANQKEIPGSVILGVRAEHISVASDDRDWDIQATLQWIEPNGADKYLHFDMPEGIDKNLIVRVSAGQSFPVGQTLNLKLDQERLFLFDHETGLACVL